MENLKNNNYMEKFKTNNFTVKILVVFIIAILLQIPLLFINSIISDRSRNYREASENIGNDWGKPQTLSGPYLVIVQKNLKEGTKYMDKTFLLLPSDLNADINLESELKHRGIYQTTVYLAKAKLKGKFDLEKLPENYTDIYLAMGLTDTKALVKVDKLHLGTFENIKLESGTKSSNLIKNGFSTESVKNYIGKETVDFEMNLEFRGHDSISVAPFGENNNINISSNWSSPSYKGILPISKENIDKGFKAKWEASNLVRNYPQFIDTDNFNFKDNEADFDKAYHRADNNFDDNAINVKLLDRVNHYTKINRATNYGMLFIMLSLVVVFIFDLVGKKKTIWLQYGVIGFSLVLFYLLLLSLAEHIGFNIAYIISSLAIVIPNGLYIAAISQNKKVGLSIGIFLSAIYTILFSILKMERYALLSGTILIMLILYIVMYLTRNDKYLN